MLLGAVCVEARQTATDVWAATWTRGDRWSRMEPTHAAVAFMQVNPGRFATSLTADRKGTR